MKKMKLKKSVKIGLCIFGIIVIALVSLIFLRPKDPLLGSWTTKGGTIYTFKEEGKGEMTASSFTYEFNYTKEDNKLSIDFVSEKAKDSVYECTIDGKNMTLKGDRGTFEFTRVEKK